MGNQICSHDYKYDSGKLKLSTNLKAWGQIPEAQFQFWFIFSPFCSNHNGQCECSYNKWHGLFNHSIWLGNRGAKSREALDPGLVYKSDSKDHFLFLYYFGYNQTQIGSISGNKSFVYPRHSKPELISNLNYPSIAISKLNGTRSVVRTLMNVGPVDSIYTATVMPPPGVDVEVSPEKLVFSAFQKSISINVQLKVTATHSLFGSLSFSDGTRSLVTPLVVNLVSV